jgi:hypothetical protein
MIRRNDSLPEINDKLNSSAIIKLGEPLVSEHKKTTPKGENYGSMLLSRMAAKKN